MAKVVKINTSARALKSNVSPKVVNSKINMSMDTTRFRFNKTPTPATNGVQTIFTIPSSEAYVTGLLEVFLDGLKQTLTTDYTETSSTTFTMVAAPDADEVLRINYIKT